MFLNYYRVFLKFFLQLPSCTPDCCYHVVTILRVAEHYSNKGRFTIRNVMCLVSVFPLSNPTLVTCANPECDNITVRLYFWEVDEWNRMSNVIRYRSKQVVYVQIILFTFPTQVCIKNAEDSSRQQTIC